MIRCPAAGNRCVHTGPGRGSHDGRRRRAADRDTLTVVGGCREAGGRCRRAGRARRCSGDCSRPVASAQSAAAAAEDDWTARLTLPWAAVAGSDSCCREATAETPTMTKCCLSRSSAHIIKHTSITGLDTIHYIVHTLYYVAQWLAHLEFQLGDPGSSPGSRHYSIE